MRSFCKNARICIAWDCLCSIWWCHNQMTMAQIQWEYFLLFSEFVYDVCSSVGVTLSVFVYCVIIARLFRNALIAQKRMSVFSVCHHCLLYESYAFVNVDYLVLSVAAASCAITALDCWKSMCNCSRMVCLVCLFVCKRSVLKYSGFGAQLLRIRSVPQSFAVGWL